MLFEFTPFQIAVYLCHMIRWMVGDRTRTIVGKFASDVNDDVHNIDKIPQPVVLSNGVPDWTVCDRDNNVRFRGFPNGTSGAASSSWLLVEEVEGGAEETEYVVRPVSDWVNFNLVTQAQRNALDLEESEKQMKDARLNARQEFNDYLKMKARKAVEKGIAVLESEVADAGDVGEGGKRTIKLMRRKVLKKLRGADGDDMEVADSAVAFQGADRDIEGAWEGDEAFSDDDEQLFEDEINANAELNIDVEDDDVVKDKEAIVDEEDEESRIDLLFKDAFGDEISKLMNEEKTKEKVTDEDLDAELKQFEEVMGDEEEPVEESPQPAQAASRKTTPEATATSAAPVMVARKATKEEQIRARIKGMFWRNEYKLKLKDILAQFPGLNRGSEDYQFLTKSLKDLAEVKDGFLHLRQQYRK